MEHLIEILIFTSTILLAASVTSTDPRTSKFLNFGAISYPYSYNEDFKNNFIIEDDDFSRTTPKRRKGSPSYNSPIYYIRLPPQPYMYVPGLGYVSQPPAQPPMHQLLNLPVNFVANGKPSTIYQWSPEVPELQQPPKQPEMRPRPTPAPLEEDSTVHKIPGQFNFNGKPDSVFVLRDSYNALYGDALQNFYP